MQKTNVSPCLFFMESCPFVTPDLEEEEWVYFLGSLSPSEEVEETYMFWALCLFF